MDAVVIKSAKYGKCPIERWFDGKSICEKCGARFYVQETVDSVRKMYETDGE